MIGRSLAREGTPSCLFLPPTSKPPRTDWRGSRRRKRKRMEKKEKMKMAMLFMACFATVSIVLVKQIKKRRRKQKSNSLPCSSCHLNTEIKPQNHFRRVLADNSYSHFKHLKLIDSQQDNSHPYGEEIRKLIERPRVEIEFFDGEMDFGLGDSYLWVEKESQLQELVDLLNKERVFAVDTEQHSLRSFLGFTALIQISTRKEDYLVDTIALHDVMGILRPVFADPNICKVFHGADNDVLWLQRDFHIYVVNLFDTAKACDILSKPQRSLAFLLETYCGVTTNKLLQREDWRQRPLSAEMVQYARTDAHYLLYIANCLAAELTQQVKKNSACHGDKLHFLLEASRRSNTTCLQLYTKEVEASPGESAALSIIFRHSDDKGCISSKSNEDQDLVRCLCTWRDLMARVHDESVRYVLSDQAIAALASEVPKNPREINDTISQADLSADALNYFFPSPSPVVISHMGDLHHLLKTEIDYIDDIFPIFIKKHLGPDGSCPLSLHNYTLLSKSNLTVTNRLSSKQNGVKGAKQNGRKASTRELFVQKFSCKAPVYHNSMGACSVIVIAESLNGRPEDEDNDFYVQTKKNICVGCGETNHYLRYRIIPSCYRVHFPEHLKSHRSHDIVLLCVDCHEVAHAAAERYKRQVAHEYEIPLFLRKVVDSSQDHSISTSSASEENLQDAGVSPLDLRTAAMALLRHGQKMPSRRREELKQVVMKFYGGREISEDDLERALLVGMSPHERRRLEKKKGLSLRHSLEEVVSNKGQKSNGSIMATPAVRDTISDYTEDDLQSPKLETQTKQEDDVPITDHISNSQCSNIELNGKVPIGSFNNINADESEASELNISDLDNTDKGGSINKHSTKLSLLGHGPHGKQVVDHILEEEGEDGILRFCQRWRQVFVDAVNPRFLPGGWNVMHSGKRDFGEFSVYNPVHKASSATIVS
ncbi:3'-5' exonuclease domain [Dillenia turbinata]|uniref:3'-5' exonuclease domain n=1 Tax=Dillenia turbinata TaxID=194707 RepID=A0AAN8YZH4_9MAGN